MDRFADEPLTAVEDVPGKALAATCNNSKNKCFKEAGSIPQPLM
jgi:hypothetical protein